MEDSEMKKGRDVGQKGKEQRKEIHQRSKGYPPGIFANQKMSLKSFYCSGCSLILRKAWQNQCGHRYCEGCLVFLSQESNDENCKPCELQGGSQSKLDFSSAVPDKGIDRDMAKLPARCINCKWHGTFVEYTGHETSCKTDDSSESGLEDSFEMVDTLEFEPEMDIKPQYKMNPPEDERDWTITDFDKKFQDAQNGDMQTIYSEPFYIAGNGYKIGACAYLNGDGMAKGRYLSLFLVIYKGEHDNVLNWPFDKKITFILVNQMGGNHIKDAFRPDLTSASFKQPVGERNTPSGISIFCPLSAFKDGHSGFVQNNSLCLKIIVG